MLNRRGKLRCDYSSGEWKDMNGAYQCMHPARIHDNEVYRLLGFLGEGGSGETRVGTFFLSLDDSLTVQ